MKFVTFIAIGERGGDVEAFVQDLAATSLEEAKAEAKRIALSKAPDGSPDFYCFHASVHEVTEKFAVVNVYG